jgi:hypothetical protein
MASILKVDKLDPQSGTALEIGSSGDTISVPSGATLDISASTLTPPATMPASSGVNLTALNASNLGSGTVPAARLSGVGKVLQYVRTNYDTNNNVASESYTTTGLTATITPTATDTHIVGFISLQCRFHNVTSAYEAGYAIAVKRDSTIIFEDDASERYCIYLGMDADAGTLNIANKSSWNFADTSHNTTSAITYTVFARVQNANEQGKFQDATFPSQLLLMEFAA